MPERGDTEFWEPKALVLLDLLVTRGPLSLRAVKVAMARKGFKVGVTVNLLSFLALTGRATFCRDRKVWEVNKTEV